MQNFSFGQKSFVKFKQVRQNIQWNMIPKNMVQESQCWGEPILLLEAFRTWIPDLDNVRWQKRWAGPKTIYTRCFWTFNVLLCDNSNVSFGFERLPLSTAIHILCLTGILIIYDVFMIYWNITVMNDSTVFKSLFQHIGSLSLVTFYVFSYKINFQTSGL